ncbi:MAG: amidohydrolase family protein [Phycisphaerales bacterium]|nr:amidohydrolase family protein [Phycisphaerales bacterium]
MPTAGARNPELVRLDAAAIADATRTLAPASLLLDVNPARAASPLLVLAADAPAQVDRHPAAANARRVSLPNRLLIPGLVNVHTHLDLTSIGPRPYAGDFSGWLDMVRRGRPTEPSDIAAAVAEGARLSLASGVVAVGDIAGAPRGQPTLAPAEALAAAGLAGVSFLEFFAIGKGTGAIDRIQHLAKSAPRSIGPVRVGLQPHATGTVGLAGYRWAGEMAARGWPVSSHVAETLDERELVAKATGPQREFLQRLALWDDSLLREFARGLSPIQHLREVLERAPFLLAHVNDASDADIELLARTKQSVAYCPRASVYFGNHAIIGPHRYRDMLAAGVNVCLGTDSIINQHPEGGLSIWREMKLLFQRDHAPARDLLAMATVNGARALALNAEQWTFAPDRAICAVASVVVSPTARGRDPLESALESSTEPELLWRAN